MFRKILFLAMLACGLLTSRTNAQTAPSFLESEFVVIDSCNSKTFIVYVTPGSSSPSPYDTVKVIFNPGDGSPSYSSYVASGTFGNYFYHYYATPGTYTYTFTLVTETDGVESDPIDYFSGSTSTYCHVIRGVNYLRGDGDCDFDTLVDVPLTFPVPIEIRKDNVPFDTIFSYMGYYSYSIQGDDLDYAAEYSLIPLGYADNGLLLACPDILVDTHKFDLDTLDTDTEWKNFYYDVNPSFTGFDLKPFAASLLRTSAGPSYMYIYYNNATVTPQSGSVSLQLSPKYTFESSSPAPSSVVGSTVTWDFADLSLFNSSGEISVTLMAASTTAVDDTAHNVVTMYPITDDMHPDDNTFTSIKTVVASFDPNDKAVTPLGAIEAGQELTYTIQFENLGEDTAFNIHVMDVLSDNLDINSFELLYSTHPMQTYFLEQDGNNVLKFDFPNIRLASKYFPNDNKGMLTFKMKAKESMVVGDEILNSAAIYFDVNPAVVTNTVRNYIDVPSSVANPSQTVGVKVYPNPTKDILHIHTQGVSYKQAIITDATGRLMMTQAIAKELSTINTRGLQEGIYFMTLTKDDGSQDTVKFIRK